jgi:ABC-type transporter Mla subunit MlaD
MAEMSMNKAIHGAVRRDLQRFLVALAAFPDGNRTRAAQLATAWTNFNDQLTRHHEGEHEIAWPALEAVGASPELLATMDAEHDLMATALADAGGAVSRLAASASAEDAQLAKAAVTHLQEVTTTHLDHEEVEFEPVLLANRNAPEIQEMGRKFGKASPSVGGRFMAWVLDGASADERAAVTRDIPAPVVKIVGGIWGRSYRKNIAPVWKG